MYIYLSDTAFYWKTDTLIKKYVSFLSFELLENAVLNILN